MKQEVGVVSYWKGKEWLASFSGFDPSPHPTDINQGTKKCNTNGEQASSFLIHSEKHEKHDQTIKRDHDSQKPVDPWKRMLVTLS